MVCANKKTSKKLIRGKVCETSFCCVNFGELRRGRGYPGTKSLFKIVAEKIPYEVIKNIQKNTMELFGNEYPNGINGVYVAHDSMGIPRYIGRGNIFNRLKARKKYQPLELVYFSFYVIEDKKHEREIETLLIRAAEALLDFNERKKSWGIYPANIKDFEPGTYFYERQDKKWGEKNEK